MKRLLLLLIILIIGELYPVSVSNWTRLFYQAFISGAGGPVDIVTSATPDVDNSVGTSLKHGLRWQQETTLRVNEKVSVTLENDYFYSRKSQEWRNSYHYNQAKLKFYYNYRNHLLKIGYGNRFYGRDETRLLNLPGVDFRTRQQMVHYTDIQYHYLDDRWSLFLYGGMRNLDYVFFREVLLPEMIRDDEEEEDDETDWQQGWENDLYLQGEVAYRLKPELKFFLNGYFKNDLNEQDWFDETRTGAGFDYQKRFDFFNILKLRMAYAHDLSNRLESYLNHQFLTQIRYTKRWGTSLAGFLAITSRSCYDTTEHKLLRISNLLRIHLKYSYLTHRDHDSYLLGGIKFNPETAGTTLQLGFNQYLIHDLYLSAAVKYAPDLYDIITGRLEYYLNPDWSCWLQDEYMNYRNSSSRHLLTSGLTLIF